MGEYTALYRSFRPRRFADVVGQEHVTRTLRNAVAAGRVAHAYLFSGPRGTGKTSVARILARAVNCREPAGGEPCNECPTCREVLEGRSLDVVEVDAASHRGIDEVRALRDQVRYAPVRCSRKVYIIDEVHMLTAEAFNALLKTLEEPPAAVAFVLATTDVHKVPATVASRCQRFDFFRLGEAEIVDHLRRVLAAVGGEAEEEALVHLARAADGAMRDALTLLDQALAGAPGQGVLTVAGVADLLGATPEEELLPLLRALFAGDATALLAGVQDAYRRGRDLRQLVVGLMRLVREGLACHAERRGAGGGRHGDLPEVLNGITWERLVAAFERLGRLEQDLRRAGPSVLQLEVGLLQIARALGDGAPGSEEEASAAAARLVPPARPFVYQPAPSVPAAGTPPRSATAAAAPTPAPDVDVSQVWRRLLDRVRRERPLLHGVLTSARPLAWRDDTLTISFRAGCTFHRDRVNDPKSRTYLEQVLASLHGRAVSLACLVEGGTREVPDGRPAPAATPASGEAAPAAAPGPVSIVPTEAPPPAATAVGDLPALALEVLGGEIVELDPELLFAAPAPSAVEEAGP